MAVAVLRRKPPHPVFFGVELEDRRSRLTTAFRLILAIPQLIVATLLGYALGIVSVIAWFAVLFTGRFPRGLFDFNVGAMRWQTNVYAYLALLRDEYPPFSTEPGLYPVLLDIPYPEKQSRIRLFVRYIAIIPNYIALIFVDLVWYFALILAWFCIVIGGRTPRRLSNFSVGVMRWHIRQFTYLYLMRDEYPPYRFANDAPPGNEVVSGIVGVPMFASYVAFYVFFSFGTFSAGSDYVQVYAPLTSPALEAERPHGEANGVRLTILGYDDQAPRPSSVDPVLGYREVSFRIAAEKSGIFPAFFTPYLFQLHDCDGFRFTPEAVSDGFEFHMFWRGGGDDGSVLFQLPIDDEPCDLTYQFTGKIEFRFLGGS